jgi:hypothetical protein
MGNGHGHGHGYGHGQGGASSIHTSTEHNIREHLGNAPFVRKDKGLQEVHQPLKDLFGDRIKDRTKK